YRALGNTQLAAIGLLSFAAIAQLAPSFFGGLFWRRATARGAMAGMLVGFAVWIYTLFGADLPPLLHGVLWSLSLNLLSYVVFSLARQPSSIELVQADRFLPNA